MKNKFIEMEHTADIKFKVYGSSLEKIFENTSLAFSDYISSKNRIKNKSKIEISLSAENMESLLYKFIEELIYLLDAESFAVSSSKVRLSKTSLKATLFGDKASNYSLKHVKAATYAEMHIKNIKKSWEAQIVLDV